MATATVCDPCYSHGELKAGETVSWQVGTEQGEITLCGEHRQDIVVTLTVTPTAVAEEPAALPTRYYCAECDRHFDKPQGLAMHRTRVHSNGHH